MAFYDQANNIIGKVQDTAAGAMDTTWNAAQTAKDKASDAIQAAVDGAGDGKDNTGGFFQQAGEQVKRAAQGTTETVKTALGLGGGNN
ncbi:hypothetical protein KSP39_PZI005578 [Platanthera zijinensis]|uniref:Late embryogenesis abundant protein n=1 Tax=Platanthera zijinensis TaxID=2320716 RepID=A0AAP0BSG8_9ASPA